ncbi:leukocyte receptor cluster member 1 homolog [Tubulanus polymorphus]|uniref:leukocyte receptor cluster member 1 homolog n=1 Tax=Tubulanus polymorphus TaxID=672921 RepID=UPI003DA5B3C4
MNILPKKNWHVRTKKNIERVRRDEAKAAEEEEECLRKIALAEQEARTNLLRERSRARLGQSTDHKQLDSSRHYNELVGPVPVPSTPLVEFVKPEHINLFEGEQSGANEEHEKEKKEEQEKYEKSIGLLTYLGQSAAESQTCKPWYYNPTEVRKRSTTNQSTSSTSPTSTRKGEQDYKKKRALDPMAHMSKYVNEKRKVDHADDEDDKEILHKKHKKHKDKKEKSKTPGKKTIEQLRAERINREKAERFRTEQVLAKARGEKIPETKTVEYDDRKRGYNSQYNPELARKPRLDEPQYKW